MTLPTLATFTAGALVLALAGPVAAQSPVTSGSAPTNEGTVTARLTTADGGDVGRVRFRDMRAGVHIEGDLTDLPPGPHGFHIHETGACTPDFDAAGEHISAEGQEHGFAQTDNPHSGDLPNIWVQDDGTVQVEFITPNLTLDQILDEDGSAVMVHDAQDTYMDPASAGGRYACGVVEQQS